MPDAAYISRMVTVATSVFLVLAFWYFHRERHFNPAKSPPITKAGKVAICVVWATMAAWLAIAVIALWPSLIDAAIVSVWPFVLAVIISHKIPGISQEVKKQRLPDNDGSANDNTPI